MWNDALPRNGITNWSVFYAQQNTTTTNGWLSWMKPAGCSWVYFFALGAGSSGNHPNDGAITTGGNGGSSGSVTRILIPATFVPDILYLRPGVGGASQATPGGAGNSGITSYVSIAPNTTAQNLILSIAGAAVATGGSAVASSSGIWLNVGLFTSIAGQNQATGAATANTAGSSVAFGASGLPITGGAGGGNGTGAGGDVTGAGLLPTVTGGAGTTGGTGNNGFRQGQTFAPGFKLFPLLFSGGSGGGGHSTGTAGNGGNGSYGCGGGGAGACSGAGVAGTPGRGGDALILIGAF
jgi:hypothetical protein